MSRLAATFLADLRAWIAAEATIAAALVTTGRASGADGVYVEAAPQGAPMPRVVILSENDPGHYHLGGVSAIRSPDFSIEAWHTTALAAMQLGDLVEAHMDGFRGSFGSQAVRGTFRTGRRLETQTRDDGGDVRSNVVVLDFTIWRAT